MSRKVVLNVTTKVVATINEGVNLSDFINELDYDFISDEETGTIIDTEIIKFEPIDSK